MSAALERRVAVLESRKCNTYVSPPPPPLSCYMIAYLGGHFDPVDSPAMNYARGLGLDKASDLAKLTPEQRHELHHKAMRKLFKRRGIDLDSDATTPAEVDEVLMRLCRQLAKSGLPVPEGSWLGEFTKWPLPAA
jgi:hypothetical protein